VYAEYGFESLEAEVADDDLNNEDAVIRDFLENVQVWAELIGDE
jgi:hypothetical protein